MKKLRITNLNLRFGLAEDGPNSWSHRRVAYPELFEAFPGDFYTFQEANDFQIEELAAMLPGYAYIGRRDPAPEGWQHNVIFYRRALTCLAQDRFYLSETPDRPSKFARSRWPRQCSLGIFDLGGCRLLLATTHFDFDPEVQKQSARLILRRLAHYPEELPMMLTGDFNTEPDSATYAVFTAEGGFENAFLPPYGGTHHQFSGQSGSRAIDWILFRGPLKPLRSLRITRPFAGYYPSDHFPLSAEFTLMRSRISDSRAGSLR